MDNPKRGEVWRVNFDPTQGAEIRKIRPAVVMSDNLIGRLPLKIVVPITEWDAIFLRYPWMTRLGLSTTSGLSKVSSADAYQVRSLSKGRFVAKIGELTASEMEAIVDAISLCVKARIDAGMNP